MTYSSLLPHKARVLRRDEQVDRFGQPKDTRYEQGSELPCRLTTAKGGQMFTERSRDVVQVTHVLFLEVGVDIREDDTLDVFDRETGRQLAQGADVVLVAPVYAAGAEHHVEAKLNIIRGTGA